MTTSVTVPMKHFEEPRANDILVLQEVWQKERASVSSDNSMPLIGTILNLLRQAGSFICISSSSPLPKELIQEIPKLASKGVRVYLLLAAPDDTLTEFTADKAIIRIDSQVTGFQILVDPQKGYETKRGYFFGYNCFEAKDNGSNYFVSLNGEQLKEAFHYFVWRFWGSPEEQRGRNRVPAVASRAPFDVYPLIQPMGYYYNSRETQYLNQKLMDLTRFASSRIQVGLSHFGMSKEFIELLVDKSSMGVEVSLYTDLKHDHRFLLELPQHSQFTVYSLEGLTNFFLLADDRVGLLLSGANQEQQETGIMLSTIDVQNLQSRLKAMQGQLWTFHKQVALRDLKSNEIMVETYDRNLSLKQIKDSEVIEHGTLETESLRCYFEGSLKPVFKEDGILSRTIIHRWKLAPKVLDAKAKKDPLYESWEKETTAFKKRVLDILEYAKTVANEKRTILNSLLGVLFSRDTNHNLERTIKELEQAKLSMEQGSYDWKIAPSLLEKMDGYIAQLREEQMQLHEQKELQEKKEAWLKERKELEADQQRLDWDLQQIENKKAALSDKMDQMTPELQQQYEQLEQNLKAVNENIQQMESEYEELLSAVRVEKKVLELCAYLNTEINRFDRLSKKEKKRHFTSNVGPYLSTELEKLNKAHIYNELTEKNRITDAKEMMKYCMKQLGTHPELRMKPEEGQERVVEEYEVLITERQEFEKQMQETKKKDEGSKSDLLKQLDQLEKEKKKTDNELQQTLKRLERLGDEFQYTPQKKDSKLPFPVSVSIRFPTEELPRTGELYRNGTVRQLAIRSENELDLGEKEAVRLGAELVLKSS